ncbi:MAG: hypothetical protein H6739_21745 [Alphaproteobacteria bacterium]|nr:hypothetical protein [Alphaproteobacteria bacterium]
MTSRSSPEVPRRRARLRWLWLAALLGVACNLGAKDMNMLVSELSGPDPRRAYQHLLEEDPAEVRAQVVDALQGAAAEDRQLREWGSSVLITQRTLHGDGQADPALVRALLDAWSGTQDAETRLTILRSWSSLDGAVAVPLLSEALPRCRDDQERALWISMLLGGADPALASAHLLPALAVEIERIGPEALAELSASGHHTGMYHVQLLQLLGVLAKTPGTAGAALALSEGWPDTPGRQIARGEVR